LNDVESQLVEIEDVPDILDCIRVVLDKGKENLPSSSEQPSDKVEKSSEQPSKKVMENSESVIDIFGHCNPKLICP